MRIVVFGASGKAGSRIVSELLSREYEVTAVVRDKSTYMRRERNLTIAEGNILDSGTVKQIAAGHNAVISAIGPSKPEDSVNIVEEAAKSLVAGLKNQNSVRLIVLGGAGSLEVASGSLLIDAPGFPEAWKPVAKAHINALAIYKKSEIDWTYVSPAAMLEPGERKGKYRVGLDSLLTDAKGESRISMDDLAIAIADELEKPAHRRMRFTVAW
jgi:uncharacterized protein